MNQSRNYWPIGLIGAFIAFFIGTICLVIFASSQRMDLVSGDYYEQEIQFQRHIDRVERAKHLPIAVSVVYEAARQKVCIAIPVEHAKQNASGAIHLYRPSAAGLDREFQLNLDEHGGQILDVKDLRRGLWKVRISWSVAGEEYAIDKSIVI